MPVNPQLLADLLAAGSNAYAANLRAQGFGYADIYYRLADRFRGANANTLSAAIDRGTRAWNAGVAMNALPAAGRLAAAQVPRGGTGGLAWRYNVFVNLNDPTTGQDVQRTFQIHSLTNLTHGELATQAQAAVGVYHYAGQQRPGYDAIPPGLVVTGMDVFSVERW